MGRLTTIFLLMSSGLVGGCTAHIARVDGTARAETWGRHHGRILAGPRVTYDSGVMVPRGMEPYPPPSLRWIRCEASGWPWALRGSAVEEQPNDHP